jgi:hypothetical protein
MSGVIEPKKSPEQIARAFWLLSSTNARLDRGEPVDVCAVVAELYAVLELEAVQ